MQIVDHRFPDLWYGQTSNLDREITPELLVLHYTCGWSGAGNRNHLMGAAGGVKNKKSSAHLVIDIDGTAWQIAPFNRRAWHAGPSRFGTLTDINSHSIGIEFQNPGWLQPIGGGRYADYFGRIRTLDELEAMFGGSIQQRHRTVGSQEYIWPLFPEAQIEAGLAIARALIAEYGLKGAVTHEQIDVRGWKVDPGPAFPLAAFTELFDDAADETGTLMLRVTATRLNLRAGPGAEFETVNPPGQLPFGAVVTPIRAKGTWVFAELFATSAGLAEPGIRGWLHSDYLEPVEG